MNLLIWWNKKTFCEEIIVFNKTIVNMRICSHNSSCQIKSSEAVFPWLPLPYSMSVFATLKNWSNKISRSWTLLKNSCLPKLDQHNKNTNCTVFKSHLKIVIKLKGWIEKRAHCKLWQRTYSVVVLFIFQRPWILKFSALYIFFKKFGICINMFKVLKNILCLVRNSQSKRKM